MAMYESVVRQNGNIVNIVPGINFSTKTIETNRTFQHEIDNHPGQQTTENGGKIKDENSA